MEKDFVPYELAVKLKALGFDEPCFGYYAIGSDKPCAGIYPYYGEGSAPLYGQAFGWFRENYGLTHEIPYAGKSGQYHAFVKEYAYGNNGNNPSVFNYEKAQIACLERLIEIIESKSE